MSVIVQFTVENDTVGFKPPNHFAGRPHECSRILYVSQVLVWVLLSLDTRIPVPRDAECGTLERDSGLSLQWRPVLDLLTDEERNR